MTKATLYLALIGTAALPAFCSADLTVGQFGDNGWYSGDTRSNTGANLLGTNDTHAGYPGTHTTADDTQIEKQIKFMHEGDDALDSTGADPGAGPLGSLNGLGYVRLDGTDQNAGKSTISIFNGTPGGFGSSSSLLGANFTASFAYFSHPNPTFRTPALAISIFGTDGGFYTLAFVDPGNVADTWETPVVNYTNGGWTLHGTGTGNNITKTLSDWAADATWGSKLYGNGAFVYEAGFNIGSSQRNNVTYIDWFQSSAFQGGQRVDFQGAAVPEPASLTAIALGGLALLRRRKNRKA